MNLTPDDLRRVLLGDNSDVRAQFLSDFGELIDGFLVHAIRAWGRMEAFACNVRLDHRAAWTQAFLFSAFNNSLTSCHLLISGLPIPAGNLMRQYGESCAMAMLCSHQGIGVFPRLDAAPQAFRVDSAMSMVREPRNAELLSVDPVAWSNFQSITSWYNAYSHASVFGLATLAKFSERGQAILGGGYDEFKRDGYRRELTIRVSSMDRLHDITEAVERNIKIAQRRTQESAITRMREISPADNMSADEFLRLAPPEVQVCARDIRAEKGAGSRPRPSARLVDRSALLTAELRSRVVDAVAVLVDENLFGRSEMCLQFAALLQRALAHLGLSARGVVGNATYYSGGREIFRWEHAWVRVGAEVIDGNVDSLFENPMVPSAVDIAPYWGPISETPPDRRLREDHGRQLPADGDVSDIWWPELRAWLDKEFPKAAAQPEAG